MVNALRRHRLSAPRDIWLYASDVVRSFPWRKALSSASCAAALLTPTAPSAGAHCAWLVPTPYEIMAADKLERLRRSASPTPEMQARISFAERTPVVFLRAGWARPRRGVFDLGARPQHARWLNVSAVRHARMPEAEFARYRYLLDVGGVSGTTWSALRMKLLTGSLVFKVELPWADWWHHTLRPWRDYVPVREDLADLRDHFVWAQAHPAEAQRIAESGARTAARTSTVAAVRAGVVDALRQVERHAVRDQALQEWSFEPFDGCRRAPLGT
mmetsp:Transcript_36915/g.108145  ORF Transcript_36915/g.108145 Transcript_36915/m.108145 type:complete len:272 (+) Transcript_36915:208-1023(+)